MKKNAALLFLMMALMALAGCTDVDITGLTETEKSMYQLYTQANEAMESVDSVLIGTAISMQMEYGEETMDLELTGSIAEVIKSETEIDMELDLTTSMAGMEMPTKAYYKDGIYYVDTFGQKIKIEMPLEDVMAQANIQTFNFPEAAIKEESLTDVGGEKELSFTLDGLALDKLLGEQLGFLKDMLGTDTGLTFGDVALKVVIDNNNMFKTMNMVFSFEMDVEGQAMKADYSITMDFVQFGGVTIDFPEDLDTYTEQQ